MSQHIQQRGVDISAFLIIALYLYAGQAHLTSNLTPGMAETVAQMTQNVYKHTWKGAVSIDMVSLGLAILLSCRHGIERAKTTHLISESPTQYGVADRPWFFPVQSNLGRFRFGLCSLTSIP